MKMRAYIYTVITLSGLLMICLFLLLCVSRQAKNEISRSPVLVLILTYMRSGSSLTGDILQHSPGAFYVYEPFMEISKRNASSYTISYANGTKRSPPFSITKETSDGLYNWFTCNITRLPVIGLLDNFLKKGIKTSSFRPCLTKEYARSKEQLKAVSTCTKQLQSICEDSPIRIIKTIRMTLFNVKHLLEELPTLKIIHLVRDPRATLLSRLHFGACKGGRWQECTYNYCQQLENDVLEIEGLIKKYPDRIYPVFYENIAKYPLETSKKMYDFIGADFTINAQTYIYNITMAGHKNDCPICTTRSNSSEHVDVWKKEMKRHFLQAVNKRCNYVLKHYKFDDFQVK